MQFVIEVIQTKVETKPSKTGKTFQQCELTYKRLDTGKMEAKKLMSFTTPAIFSAASAAAAGSQWEVVSEKEGEYWQWKSFTAIAPGATPSSKPVVAGTIKSTYETPEERAKKQVYIIKQSSLAQAIALLSVGAKVPPSTELVLQEAQKFTAWVMDTAPPKVDLFDEDNDIPD